MKIGGLQKMTLVDYPSHIACTIFTKSCNFRCGYCHNPELVQGPCSEISEQELFHFLEKRQNLLDAVSISGGEPTMHDDLEAFIRRIKTMGFKVKLDTNGSRPDMIQRLLDESLLDYIAMDIKAAPENYAKITNVHLNFDFLFQSKEMIMNSGLDYEFRMTILPFLHDELHILKALNFLSNNGESKVRNFYFQNFRNTYSCLNPAYSSLKGFDEKTLNHFVSIAQNYAHHVACR